MREWKKLLRHPNIYEYETRRGKRYGVRRGFTNSLGRKDEFTRSGFLTWRAADIVLKQFEASLVTGQINPITHRGVTVTEYFEKMCKRNEELGIWRESTLASQKQYFNNHLKPIFGSTSLAEVKRSSYQQFIDNKVKQGFAQTTVSTMDAVMQHIYNDAENNDIIDKNRLKGISIQGAVKPRSQSLSVQDYNKFMAAAKTTLSKYQMTMLYLMTLGERRSELAGLQIRSFVKGIDAIGTYYAITFYVGRTQYAPLGGPLKTPSANRTIYVRGEITEYIDYALERTKEVCKKSGRVFNGNTFLYVDERTGMPIFPGNINRILFQRVNDKIGTHVRPHMLRHYFATHAKENGLPDMAIMHWLGHKNVEMTNDYTRPTEEGAKKIFGGMSKDLFG